jgi:hypothetical protein
MSKVNVNLSSSEQGAAIFHNLAYTNDAIGGNKNEMTFEVTNWSGNEIQVEVAQYVDDPVTKKMKLVWAHQKTPVTAVRLTIRGSCENDEFLRMLQLILEAEKMVEIIKP